MSQENVEIVKRAFDAFQRGDVEALTALLAPDAEIFPLRAALEDTSYAGPDSAAQFVAATTETWSAVRVDVEEMRDHGDRVLVLGLLIGTAREGRVPVTARIGWVIALRAAKITKVETFPDPGDALAAAERPGS